MQNMSAWMQALGGLAIGAAAGFAVRHARLCTFGAIEDALMGGDSRRLRVFGLALGIAILGTQALVIGGVLDPALVTYTPAALPLVAIVIGSVMFGIGMAMVGTCGFGSLVRLGTGDLRSLVVVLILGAAAYATL
ncbi:MAG: YeeE/YedE thiosulfate transporter family protein, partial [Afipia sp.]